MSIGIITILWQEAVVFKKRFWTITTGSLVTPMLYMLAFGWGAGRFMSVPGTDYTGFILPGIIALTTMINSFNAVSSGLNISRLYEKSFDEYIIAPLSMAEYTAGKILAGALRGMYSGFLIMSVSLLFMRGVKFDFLFPVILFLNCLVFSGLGFVAAMLIKSHPDMNRFNNFVITPMSFLCGTFFSIHNLPPVFRYFILCLPLTHSTQGLRACMSGNVVSVVNIAVLVFYFTVLFISGILLSNRVE